MGYCVILFFFLSSLSAGDATSASHFFSPYEADVLWSPSTSSFLETSVDKTPVRILHITDNHISVDDDDPPRTSRMYNAFLETSDHETQHATTPKEELKALLRKARKDGVDLIAFGGDLVNYPSPKTVAWIQEQIQNEAGGIPYIYTAGNHDWHEEGLANEKYYDSARLYQLNTTLRPLFDRSVASTKIQAGPGAGRLYGKTSVRNVDVVFIDNSNYQVNEEQSSFLQTELNRDPSKPIVLLMHMPLKLKGTPPLEPKYLCGHPAWGAASDDLHETESRPAWPAEGNSPSTLSFIELVQKHSAPEGRIAALLTGHVHKDFSAALLQKNARFPHAANLTALACNDNKVGCAMENSAAHGGKFHALGALQYTTLDAAQGGYRLLTVRHAAQNEVHSVAHRLQL